MDYSLSEINQPIDRQPWPVRPRPIDGEAVVGFLMRVARANGYESLQPLRAAAGDIGALYEGVCLTLSESKKLFGPCPSDWGRNEFELGLVSTDFNHHLMRWCPLCLLESAHLRGQWMLKLCCVCSRHGISLHDRCPLCGLVQRLERVDFERCRCGARLIGAPAVRAATPIVRMTKTIEGAIFGNSAPMSPPSLSAAEWLRMARYLGQFNKTCQPVRPGKVANLHQLETATHLMLGVGQLLDKWPKNFHAILAAVHRKAEPTLSIRRTFGSIYRVLYADLRGEGFQFLRDAFEGYLHANWAGLVCRRNRRLQPDTVAGHPNMTVKKMAQRTGTSPAIVRHLIQAALIPIVERTLPSGRHSRSVHQREIDNVTQLSHGALSLKQTAVALVLTKRRVRELVVAGMLKPLFSRPAQQSAAWLFSRDALLHLSAIPGTENSAAEVVTLGRILRTWRLREGEFPPLIQAITDGVLVSIGDAVLPIGKVSLEAALARAWLREHRRVVNNGLSIDEAARHLGIKQQVAYELVARRMLRSTDTAAGKRIHSEDLEAFQTDFISLAELARQQGQSIQTVLRTTIARPVCGPSIDGSRQYFFCRQDLAATDSENKTAIKPSLARRAGHANDFPKGPTAP